MEPVIKLLVWVVVSAGVKIWLDKHGRKPLYVAELTVMMAVSIPYAVWIIPHPFETWELHELSFWQLIAPYAPIWIFQATSFWIFFEFGLNYVQGRRGFKNGLGLLYYDHKELDSGWIDKRFAKIYFRTGHHRWHTAAKIAAFIVMILSAIVTVYNHAIY